ncbi:MAG: tetratricopeptide repeat protein [Hydrococcus sp. CSU_1_8]|nr:tetratricopeptide repeat protein [Hydrococcus sp. CSU_1_8]
MLALLLEPDNAELYFMRGNIFYDLENDWQALIDYKRAIDIAPDYADAYFNQGIIYSYLNESRQAINNFQQAADLYQSQGKYDEALEASAKIKDCKKIN